MTKVPPVVCNGADSFVGTKVPGVYENRQPLSSITLVLGSTVGAITSICDGIGCAHHQNLSFQVPL